MEIFMPGDLDMLSQMRDIKEATYEDEIYGEMHTQCHHKHKNDYEDDDLEQNCLCKCKNGYIKEENKKDMKDNLKIISESIYDEMYDAAFYEYLLKLSDTEEERCILKSIIEDEIKHRNLLKKIYCDLTGKEVKADEVIIVDKPNAYINGIKKAHHGEIKTGEKYRKLRQNLKDECHRDMLLEIFTDEFKHANWLNYILATFKKTYKQ